MTDCACDLAEAAQLERKTLRILLFINGGMFIVEAVAGWWGQSTGLLADALDMLADASVYGVALYAVGKAQALKAKAATASGYVQILLGIGVLAEVVRRFLYGSDPVSVLMMSIGAIAFLANLSCLALLAKHRSGEVHMRASWIFSVNDVIANLGLVIAGGLVLYFDSRIPDLVIGAAISTLVVRGGVRILREAKAARESELGA